LSVPDPDQPAAPDPDAPDSGVHYDVPPRIFELLLDRNMNYSSGYYPKGDEDLDTAQVAKMDRIAQYLALVPGDRILDLGCGWCGPALYFAERHGCRVTGVTLSAIQREYALAWAARRGLAAALRVDVRDVMDLRYAAESFDQIIFLESIIHMPQKDEIFRRCAELLRPRGRILIQESNYDRESARADYLSHRGFDEVNRAFGYASHLVSAGEMVRCLEEAGLAPLSLENISAHYVRTLSQWLDRLDDHAEEMQTISTRGYRMLRRYLIIALATYRSGRTLCHLITAEKPG